MAKETTIILGEYFDNFVQSEIKSGRYFSVCEVTKSGLRLLEIEQNKSIAINRALKLGEESGEPCSFDNAKFKLRMKKKLK